MTLEQLKTLNEDELSILWFMVNKVNPPVLNIENVELPPSIFPSIKQNHLMDRIEKCKQFIKPEKISVYDSLVKKLTSVVSYVDDRQLEFQF
jgi:hypothetical protein